MDELVKMEAHDAEVLCLEYSKPETGEPMAGWQGEGKGMAPLAGWQGEGRRMAPLSEPHLNDSWKSCV